MPERFTGFEPTESKEISVKDRAREMLGWFRAKFGKGEKVPEKSPEPTAVTTAEAKEELVRLDCKETEVAAESKNEQKKKQRAKARGAETFASKVTEKYFEDWDTLELEGNDELEETIRDNIKYAEDRNMKDYIECARNLKISVEELKARLQKKVDDMVRKAHFFRATRVDVLEKIMGVDWRWKSQFETGTSQGTLDPRYRAIAEIQMFGFNKAGMPEDFIAARFGDDLPEKVLKEGKEKRPIYGYFSDDENGAIGYTGTIPPPSSVSSYGGINVKVKMERALAKATITFHDSLGHKKNAPPTPAARPHFTSFRIPGWSAMDVFTNLKRSSLVNWGESYTEVQYHGGLTMDDVESIHVSSKNDLNEEEIKRVREMVKKYKEQHPESTIELIEF